METKESKETVAQRLVTRHFRLDSGLRKVYRFLNENEDKPEEPIKLLEVTQETFATGRVDTFTFAASGDIPYPISIATITPEEMRSIQQGQISLPKGWKLENKKLVRSRNRPRPLSRRR